MQRKSESILAVSILVLVGPCALSQPANAQARAYVTNSSAPLGTFNAPGVSVIDTSSNTVVTTVGVGDTAWGVAIKPDGTRAYVANNGSASVSVIDTSSNTVVSTVRVGNAPIGVAITPNGTRAYVTNHDDSTVSVIDTSSNTVVAAVAVGSGPNGLAITPDGSRVYVTATGTSILTPGSVSVVATSSNTVVAKVAGLNQPAGVAITPDGTRAYVTNTGGGGGTSVSVIDIASTDSNYNTVVAKISVGSAPWGVAITPDGTRAYVTNEQSKSVSVIDTLVTDSAYNTVVATVGVGVDPIGVAIAPGPKYSCSNTITPVITSVDSASSYGGYSYFASGSWLEIKGTNLADPTDPRLTAPVNPGQWTASDFNGANAPTLLDGISASINGKPAYVWYLSPGQINVQAPEDSTIGNVSITVTNCKAASAAFTFARRALAPGLLSPLSFNLGGKQYMVATFNSDGAYVLNTGAVSGINSRPAKPGDLIIAYGIGFGDVTPPISPGVIVQQSNKLTNPVAFSFGSANAALSYSGLAGNFVGLYEFYITVPPGLANGDYQINVKQNGTSLPQTMYLTVHN